MRLRDHPDCSPCDSRLLGSFPRIQNSSQTPHRNHITASTSPARHHQHAITGTPSPAPHQTATPNSGVHRWRKPSTDGRSGWGILRSSPLRRDRFADRRRLDCSRLWRRLTPSGPESGRTQHLACQQVSGASRSQGPAGLRGQKVSGGQEVTGGKAPIWDCPKSALARGNLPVLRSLLASWGAARYNHGAQAGATAHEFRGMASTICHRLTDSAVPERRDP